MASSISPFPSGLSRNVVVAGSVVLFHAAALWALQSGLLLRAAEVVVPVEILSQFVDPPKPVPPPPPPPPPSPAPPAPQRKPVVAPKAPTLPPPPRPQATKDPAPAPAAPASVIAPPAPLPPIEQPVAPVPAPAPPAPPPAPPAPPQIQLPSSDAAYLQNPSPAYPAISRRLGEQGKVLVRVLIGTDGLPERAEIKRSSGFERLDRAASEYVMKCRYLPGKVNGVAQAMWYEAPVNFVLE